LNSFAAKPVVFNEPDHRALVENGVVNVVELGVGRDDHEGNPCAIPAAAEGGFTVIAQQHGGWGGDACCEGAPVTPVQEPEPLSASTSVEEEGLTMGGI